MNRTFIKSIIVIALLLSLSSVTYACDSVSIQLNYVGINVPKGYNAYVEATATGIVNLWEESIGSSLIRGSIDPYVTGTPGPDKFGIEVNSPTAVFYSAGVTITGYGSSNSDTKSCGIAVVEVGSVTTASTSVAAGSNITFTANPNPAGFSLIALGWYTTYSADGSSWSEPEYAGAANPLTVYTSEPGYYRAWAGNGVHDVGKGYTVAAVQLNGVTVESGATQTNVTGSKNWAAVKADGEFVIVEAILNPSIPNADVPKVLSWSGGSPVEGNNRQRKVSKSSSAHTPVTATVGSNSDYVDIWIIWASVQIQMTSTTPPNAVQFGAAYDGTENLGAKSFAVGTMAVGKVVPIGTITPSGVNSIISSGFTFDRQRISHDFTDGVKFSTFFDTTWQTDPPNPMHQNLTPDVSDQIYDRDAPGIWQGGGATDSYETYNNFRQWITWNGVVISDYAYWYWKGWWKDGENPEITLKQVGPDNITLPGEDEAYYDPP
jgi:hypothetical protein